jgi:hypothetical protein
MESETGSLEKRIKCVTCGTTFDDFLERCSKCGAAMPTQKCPRCDLLCDPGTSRCVACGYEFSSNADSDEEGHMESLKQLNQPLERAFRSQDCRLAETELEIERLTAKIAKLEGLEDEAHIHMRKELEEKLKKVTQERDDIQDIRKGVQEIDRMYKALLDMKAREFRSAMEALAEEVRLRRGRETISRKSNTPSSEIPQGSSEHGEGVSLEVNDSNGKTGLLCGLCHKDLHDIENENATCDCGQAFHKDCVIDEDKCTSCNHLFGPDFLADKLNDVECPMCGEMVPVGCTVDLLRANCHSCGSILRRIDEGYNYLVVDETPETAYREFKLVQKNEVPGLCLSTTFPEKIRREFGLTEADQYWFSDTNLGEEIRTLDPRRLDFETIRVIGNFFKNSQNGVLLIDGLEYLLVENGFGKVLQFVKRVIDLASLNNATIIIPLTPSSLEKDQFARLRKEFDRVHILAS